MSTYESLISIGQDYGVFVLDQCILLMCHCYWRALGWSYPCHVSQNCDVFYVKNPIKLPMQRMLSSTWVASYYGCRECDGPSLYISPPFGFKIKSAAVRVPLVADSVESLFEIILYQYVSLSSLQKASISILPVSS
jgi:hypothetical protein